MTERILTVEAESFDEAREQATAQTPDGYYLLSEEIISDGKSNTLKGVADTVEIAVANAKSEIPTNGIILNENVLAVPRNSVIMVKASDVQSAEQAVKQQISNNTVVKGIKLVSKGRKGVFGIGVKLNEYEVELFQMAVVEITYKTKVNISVKLLEVEPLINALEINISDWANSEKAKASAETILKQLKDVRTLELFSTLLKDKRWGVREFAAEILGEFKDSKAVEPLILALKDDSWSVREKAARSLGKLDDSKAIEPLTEVLNDSYLTSKQEVMDWGMPGETELVRVERYPVREAAADALEHIRFEFCEIKLIIISSSKHMFVATATGPAGLYDVGQSDVFNSDLLSVINKKPYKSSEEKVAVESTLNTLKQKLIKDGWEPNNKRREYWYGLRFQRLRK